MFDEMSVCLFRYKEPNVRLFEKQYDSPTQQKYPILWLFYKVVYVMAGESLHICQNIIMVTKIYVIIFAKNTSKCPIRVNSM